MQDPLMVVGGGSGDEFHSTVGVAAGHIHALGVVSAYLTKQKKRIRLSASIGKNGHTPQ